MEIPVVPGNQAGKKRSVRLKINIAIVAVFALMIACLMVYSYIDERQNNLDLAITQIKGMNAFYFDSLNTLMIADVMEEREVLREKMLELPGVVDVRVNRSEAIVNKFGPGLPGELPVDELDHRGLSGESIIEVGQRDGERIITVIEPYLLTEDTRGTDCLECHRRIESGTVGGTVRISYSLQQADDIAFAALWKKFGVISSLCVLALIALSMLMNRVVVRPVSRTVECLRDIASGEGDLKTCVAMMIMDRFDAGGSYTEFYAMDFNDDFFLFHYKTEFCPIEWEHNYQKCVFAHSWDDFRRNIIKYPYGNGLCQKIESDTGICKNYVHCTSSHSWYEL